MTENFKIVHLTYTESASIIVKANTDEEAMDAVNEEFPDIPNLEVTGIEDPDDETKLEIMKFRQDKIAKEKLN